MNTEPEAVASGLPHRHSGRVAAAYPVTAPVEGRQAGPRHAQPADAVGWEAGDQPGDTPPPSQEDVPRRSRLLEDPHGAVVVRNRAVDLMLHAGGKHAEHVWEGVPTPVATHAVMFLYVNPAAVEANDAVFVAPRYLVAGPESDDLAAVLAGVTRNALHLRLADDRFDARTHLATSPGQMPGGVTYAGASLSTLDTEAGPFAQVRRLVSSPWHAPTRCFLELVDRTRILIDRNTPGQQTRAIIRSTRTLAGARYTSRPWIPAVDLVREPQTQAVWWLLHLLNQTVAGPGSLTDER